MSLTPVEQEELRRLEAFIAEEEERQQGAQVVERARPRPRPDVRAPRPFSAVRSVTNILRNSAQGLIDTFFDVSDNPRLLGLDTMPVTGSLRAAWRAGTTLAGRASGMSREDTVKRIRKATTLPIPRGTEDAGLPERLVTGIGEFMVPFVGWRRAFGSLAAKSVTSRIARDAAAGAAVDFTQYDPAGNNLANILRDGFGVSSPMLDALAAEDDDDALMVRFKAAAAAAPVGVAADALLELGGRGVRAYRDWRSSRDQAQGIVEAIQRDYRLKPESRGFAEAEEAAAREAGEAAEQAPKGDVAKKSVSKKSARATKSVDAKLREEAATLSTPDDVLAYLQKKVGDEVPDDILNDVATRLLDGDPGDTLARFGIDASKIDFSSFDKAPEMLRAFQEGLANIIGKIANRLGRTGTTVSTRETQTAARVLATTDDALRLLNVHSEGLAETLMAGRIIVESHAHRVMQLRDAALAEITAGGPAQAWEEFAQAFTRHAYFQGAVRGASSEVGRALRSLQMATPAARKSKAKAVTEEAGVEAKEQATSSSLRNDAETWLQSATTDAEKIEILKRVQEAAGDVGELTRLVRVKTMTKLKRVDMALRETVGNLFSNSTFWLNTAAGASMLGVRSAAKFLAALGRAPAGLVSQRQADIARFHLLDAIAYTDGMIRGFGESFHNVVALYEREVGAEAALHLNALGFDKLAKQAALMSARGTDKLKSANYKRDDVTNNRAFSLTPAEEHRLGQLIRSLDGPQFMQTALKGLVKTMGAAGVNTLGTLSRVGTLLFVNTPDELVGSVAARAGAQSQALRIANEEAVELGLGGKELWRYLKARSFQLSRHTEGWGDEAYEQGQREALVAAGVNEAREVLFQDQLEFSLTRLMQRAHQNTPILAPLITAFFKTPMRILERTTIDFSPLGLAKDRIRKAVLAGGPEGDEALARLAIGMTAVATAMMLAEDRITVGLDGGFKSSGRIGRPSYSIVVGDDVIELHRVDPFGTLMGWGADLAQVLASVEDDITRENIFGEVVPAMVFATAANILEKSWLTDIKNFTDLMGATSEEQMTTRWKHFLGNYANRFTPAAGVQRTLIRSSDPFVREADNFITRAYQTTLGAELALPVRRDQIGRPVERTTLERTTGVPGGPRRNDPLDRELETLSFAWPKPRRTLWGADLNPHQYSRLLELRGQIVRDPETGLNMEETLRELIEHPDWDTLSPAAKIEEIRAMIEPFTELAHEALLDEDTDFARDVLRAEVNTEGELEGWTRDERAAVFEQYARELGLR